MCVICKAINLRGPNHLSGAPFQLTLGSTFPRSPYISGERQRGHKWLVPPREETRGLTLYEDILSK